jgi:hypothetical protein
MKRPRRQFLHLAAGALALPAVSRIARAQAYPTRPITMIVPFPAGGAADVIGRVVAEQMGKLLGQPVIVENFLGSGRKHRCRPRRSRAARWLYDLSRCLGYAGGDRRHLFVSIQRVDRFCAHLADHPISVRSLCATDDTGEGLDRIDRLAEGQS